MLVLTLILPEREIFIEPKDSKHNLYKVVKGEKREVL